MYKKFFVNWAVRIGSIASVALIAGTIGAHASAPTSAAANSSDNGQQQASTGASNQQSFGGGGFFQSGGGQAAQSRSRAS